MALALCACAERVEPASFASSEATSNSAVCRSMLGKFVGLPAPEETRARPGNQQPLAGRWWVRHCSTRTEGAEIIVRLGGPGWYWVDSDDGTFRVHQQVPLKLDVTLTGILRADQGRGIISVWFDPSRTPEVDVRASHQIHVTGEDRLSSLLANVPLSPVPAHVAREISAQASAAFRTQLDRGVTVTYDIWRDQSDLALGKLGVGQTPQHDFDDGRAWLANDRLALPLGATHVLGPFEPGLTHHLDLSNETGPGIHYLALCEDSMAAQVDAISRGSAMGVPKAARIAEGALLGEGSRSTTLAAQPCPFYLVVFNSEEERTVAALRVRL